ncbi:MAG TPA: transketolase [Clostridia bacterium]|nr:transketolase [Clostridia bacterium]
MDIIRLKTAAAEIRKLTIRAMASAGYGHIGGSMSICEALAVLYGAVLRVDPARPDLEERDRLILSKGHCGPALYAALAYHGYFDPALLATLNADGTLLPSHCDRLKTPGVDLSTGSLGQGMSLGLGAALGLRMKGFDSRVYIIVGDGELQEGQVWEGVQFAAHRNLDNVALLVDANKRQLDGYVADICRSFDLAQKFEAFGFVTFGADGRDCASILDALTKARDCGRPAAVILDTEKGQGCRFAEEAAFNHYMTITPDMAEEACREIDRRLWEDAR